MLKMDFLGLTTLTVIHDALDVDRARAPATRAGPRHARRSTIPTTYRMLRAGRTAGVFQFESPLATDMLRSMRCDRFDDLVASQRADAPRPARRRHAQGLSAPEARRGAGHVRAARARADPRADVRRHHLSGAGDAHRAGARGHLARRSRRAAQGGGQEGRGADPAGARQVHREGGRARLRPRDHRGARRADRDVRPLRLQQVALGRVLDHLVPHRVAQGALPRRVHGGAAVVVDRRHGQRREVHQRGARARASRCCRPTSTSRATSSPSRRRSGSASGSARSATSDAAAIDSILAAQRDEPFTTLLRPRRARRPAAVQQAGVRGADRVGRARRARRAPRAVLAVARHRAAGSVAQAAGEGDGPGLAVRAGRRCRSAGSRTRRACCPTSRRWRKPSG